MYGLSPSIASNVSCRAPSIFPRFGFVFCGIVRDREVNPVRVWRFVPSVAADNLIGEMVEGAHEVLNGVTGDQRHTFGDGFGARDVINQLARLLIMLGPDFIRIGVKEGMDLSLQLRDVVLGPLDF